MDNKVPLFNYAHDYRFLFLIILFSFFSNVYTAKAETSTYHGPYCYEPRDSALGQDIYGLRGTCRAIEFHNRYTLDPEAVNYRLAIVEYDDNIEDKNYSNIHTLSTSTIIENLRHDSNGARDGAIMILRGFNNIENIYTLNYTCKDNKGLISFIIKSLEDDERLICDTSERGGEKVYNIKSLSPTAIVSTNTLIINPMSQKLDNNYRELLSNLIDPHSLYSNTNILSRYIDPSLPEYLVNNFEYNISVVAATSSVFYVIDDWYISPGAQGLMMKKKSRTYFYEDGNTKIENYNNDGQLIVNTPTMNIDDNNATPNVTSSSSVVAQYATDTIDEGSNVGDSPELDSAKIKSDIKTEKSIWGVILDVLMFWR